jgi:LytS/YehU family sensor histidine kinase
MAFYANILWLFPLKYEKDKIRYWIYGVILMGIILAFIEIGSEIVFGSRRHHHQNWLEVLMMFRHALWLFLIFMTGTVYSIQEMLNKNILHQEKMMEEKLKTELQLLKAQINPHFLFNALNNIYSLTYMKSEKAPESVLKLSEMLRYVLDDCSNDSVPLSGEITYISNFIEFYKMKIPGERNIRFEHFADKPEIPIAPMVFIPFVENCFKYSRLEEDKQGHIKISLTESSGNILFEAVNSTFKGRPINEGSGKGISNVRQRLEIIYQGKYELNTFESDDEFKVKLNLDLS